MSEPQMPSVVAQLAECPRASQRFQAGSKPGVNRLPVARDDFNRDAFDLQESIAHQDVREPHRVVDRPRRMVTDDRLAMRADAVGADVVEAEVGRRRGSSGWRRTHPAGRASRARSRRARRAAVVAVTVPRRPQRTTLTTSSG